MLADQYRLDRRLGAGGMGEVWQAMDLRMERPVAIKVVLTHLGPEHRLVERLLREAKAAGALQHPGITVVHTIGEHNSRPFFVMELLDGEDLATVLRRHPNGLATDTVLSVAGQVCDALAAAHEKGILHRDVKPANLVLLPNGVVKICDFGVAKLADATTGLSHGNIIGTPSYMSPEQFKGAALDGRSDLYSLGCTIHALAAGAPPFRTDQAPMAVAFQHLSEPPPSLRDLRPDLPQAFAELVTELLAKETADRPAGAAAVRDRVRAIAAAPPAPRDSHETVAESVTEDVTTPVTDEPGATRRLVAATEHLPALPPESPLRQAGARTVASVLVAVLAVAVLGGVVFDVTTSVELAFPILLAFLAGAATAMVIPRPQVRVRLTLLFAAAAVVGAGTVLLRYTVGVNRFVAVPIALGAGAAVAMIALVLLRAPARAFVAALTTCIAAAVGAFLDQGGPRSYLLVVLATVAGVAATVFVTLDAPIRRLLVLLVTVPAIGLAVLVFWDAETAGYVRLDGPTDVLVAVAALTVLAFVGLASPLRMAHAAVVGLVAVAAATTVLVNPFQVIETVADTTPRSCADCPGVLPPDGLSAASVSSVAFSPDGDTLASSGGGGGNGAVMVWPLAGTATASRDYTGAGGDFTSVAFSPDGTKLAFAGANSGEVRILDRATDMAPVQVTGVATNVYAVAFSPDGTLLASAGTAAEVRLWNAATGQDTGVLTEGLSASISSIAFSPDGTTLAAAGGDMVIHVWNLATGAVTATLAGHTDWVHSVAFSPDGATLVSGSRDNTVRLWDVASGSAKATLSGHTGPVSAVAFSPDGTTVASGSWDYTARLWDVATMTTTRTFTGHTGGVTSLAFRADGRTLATGGYDGAVRFWKIR